jgi:nicotinamide-nucleotide amidase
MAGSPQAKLEREARRLTKELARSGGQLVLAESCTGGLAAATLAQTPGISKHLCGSAVVYQSETKAQWLKISKTLLKKQGAESLRVTELMARQILEQTRQATISGAITGDLGPLSSQPEKVGVIFVACAIKTRGTTKIKFSAQIRLKKPRGITPQKLRIMLQQVASTTLLRMVRLMLSDTLRQPQGD